MRTPPRHPVVAVFPQEILDQVQDVDDRLRAQAVSREKELEDWTREVVTAGGKRFRTMLMLTVYAACGGHRKGAAGLEDAKTAAVAMELVHAASLVHDDIMDEAAERRGRPSTYAAHGRDGAILVGDFLFTQAFALAARLPKVAMEMTADACRRLCEGQLREQRLMASGAPDRDAYVAVIRDKTAALIAAGSSIAASLAGMDDEGAASMYRYGDAIGHAFQVLDDVLDVTGDPQWTGKPAGSDYKAGTWSSPYLHHVERGGTLPKERSAAQFPKVRAELYASGAIAASQLEASAYTQAALLELRRMPPSQYRDALEALATLLMERVS
jgi:geranylgeranyl pyrophosphate synthase